VRGAIGVSHVFLVPAHPTSLRRKMDSRMVSPLVLIDGLPGSGKTTLAYELGAHLSNHVCKVDVLIETAPIHPLHPIPTDEIGAAWPNIHLVLSPDEFAHASLALWRKLLFSHDTKSGLVIESFPFQSAIRVLLQMDADQETIEKYWRDWTYEVQFLEPQIIFLRSENPSQLITDVAEIRGPQWQNYITQAVEQMPFSVQRCLSGWSAVQEFMTQYANLVDRLIEKRRVAISILEAQPKDYNARLDLAISALN